MKGNYEQPIIKLNPVSATDVVTASVATFNADYCDHYVEDSWYD